jgi:hypothetical protein
MRGDFVAHGICTLDAPLTRQTANHVNPGARIPSAIGDSASVTSGMLSG